MQQKIPIHEEGQNNFDRNVGKKQTNCEFSTNK